MKPVAPFQSRNCIALYLVRFNFARIRLIIHTVT